jgi:hypothetical protein
MPGSILHTIFRRVEMTKCEAAVLQAILQKANIYGAKATVAIATLAAMSGYSERSVYRAIRGYGPHVGLEGRLLHVDRTKIRWNWNTINVYCVIVPWRFDPQATPSALPWYTKSYKRGDTACHPQGTQGRKPAPVVPSEPAKPSRMMLSRQQRCPHPPDERVSMGTEAVICTQCYSVIEDD